MVQVKRLQENVQNAMEKVTNISDALSQSIPAGIQSGQQVRVAGKGERGINGGPNGDLYIEILVTPHKVFSVKAMIFLSVFL